MAASVQRMERLHREVDDERKKGSELSRVEADAASLRTGLAQAKREAADLRSQLASLAAQSNAAEGRAANASQRCAELESRVG